MSYIFYEKKTKRLYVKFDDIYENLNFYIRNKISYLVSFLKKKCRKKALKIKLFSYLDCFFKKDEKKILFVIKSRICFSGNLRVTLEAYLNSNNKLYVYKEKNMSPKIKRELESLNVKVLEGFNFKSIWHILTAGTIILSHSPRDVYITRRCKNRKIINLWHGVAIKKIELLMSNMSSDKLKIIKNNSLLYDMIIASSDQDRITNSKAFGVPLNKVIVTGLPRYEILKPNYKLSNFLKEEEKRIIEIKKDKKLVLFAPTFRENSLSVIKQITYDEWQKIQFFSEQFNIIFAIRPHPYEDIKNLSENIKNHKNLYIFDALEFSETNLLLKYTDILIVDFSSIWVDFLLLKRPIIGFAKDYYWYLKQERGFIYDFKSIFPGNFVEDIDILLEELKILLNIETPIVYEKALQLFHKYSLEFNYSKKIYNEIENIRNIEQH